MTLPNFPSSGDSGDAGQPGGLPNYDAMPSGPMMGMDDASLAGLKKNTMAVVALVLAIVGLLLCWAAAWYCAAAQRADYCHYRPGEGEELSPADGP